MTSSRDPGAPTTAPDPVAVHPQVTAFAQAWQDGHRPSLDDFRAADPSLPETLLGPLACVELEGRLQAGEKARVEDYLQRYPELETMPDEVVRLIGTEYDSRRSREPHLSLKEFTSRFPQYRTELQSLWQSGGHASILPSTVGQATRSQLAAPSSGTDAEPAPATVSDLKRPPSAGEVAEIETRIEPTPASVRRGRGEQPLPAVPGYTFEGLLGRGGMGVVYKARHIQLNRRVALKMILAGGHAGEDQLDRFLAEAQAVAKLQHPSIVQIYEIGEHDGRPYFSLEFADGGSLASRLDGTPRPPRQSAHLVRTLAQAMHVAHQHGIVHRDLKPANVLMALAPGTDPVQAGADPNSLDREKWLPKIADFGLAKQLDQDAAGQTQSGAIMGTPSYMAPEQAEGRVKDIGPAADVYALGVILYELLVGRVPFKGASVMETLEQVRTQEPVPLTQLQPKVSRDLETICLKCLHKEAPKRYASAADLAEDLRRFLDDEPIRARPVGEWDTFWRWCRRNPSLAWTSLVAAGAVGALIVLVVLFALNKADPDLAGRAKLAEDRAKSYEGQLAELERGRKNVSAGDIDDLRRQLDELARNPGNMTAAQMDELRRRLNELKPDSASTKGNPEPRTDLPTQENWTSLFNGKDLTGWNNPGIQSQFWKVQNGFLHYTGKGGQNLVTEKNYKDFEMRIDWLLTTDKGDSGVYLRGQPQVQIWSNREGSGGLWNNPAGSAGKEPRVVADKPLGEWNTMYIKVVGDKVTVKLNDRLVVDEAPFRPMGKAPPAEGPLELQIHGTPLWFRNIYVRPLDAPVSRTTEPKPSPPATVDNWVSLFNGRDLSGWTLDSGPADAFQVIGGVIVARGRVPTTRGFLLSNGSYSDFQLKCQFQQSSDADGGIAFRVVSGEKVGTSPMHLVVKLRRTPVARVETGSLYYYPNTAESPTRSANLQPVGSWNDLLIEVRGQRLRVWVNGPEVQNLDLNRIAQMPKVLPGINRSSGRIGLQQHSGELRFRDIQVKDLK